MTPEVLQAGNPGAVAGGFVIHQQGCPLGDRVRVLNDAGFVPSITTYTGCDR